MARLTNEEKTRWAPMLRATYEAIAADANCDGVDEIIDMTCDANHPEMYGGMTREEYKELCRVYDDPDTQTWLKETLNY